MNADHQSQVIAPVCSGNVLIAKRPARMSRRLDQMRRNPQGDWTVADIVAVCREFGITCEPARGGGSHYKVWHPAQATILTVPYKRPIKPVYIRKLVALVDAVRASP